MPFIQSPWPLLLLVSIYLFIVGMGKKWMEHRKPMQIDPIIIAYNSIQIFVNSMLALIVSSFFECTLNRIVINYFLHPQMTYYIFIAKTNFSFQCEPINFATDSMGMCVAYVTYSYFILKLIDYFDTVFFILRKKWAHVSFLHVYHHLMISVGSYMLLIYAPGLKM